MRAGEQPNYALVPPGMPGYRFAELSFRHQPMAQRLERARALHSQAGYGPDNPLSFDLNISGVTESHFAGVALQGMWNDIGVKARMAPYESAIHYAMLRKRDFEVTWAGWIADYRDAKNYLMLFQSGTTALNYGDYANPKFDTLVARSDNEHDPARREDLLRAAEQIVLDDAVFVFGFLCVARNLVSPHGGGGGPNNVNIHRSRFMSLNRGLRTV